MIIDHGFVEMVKTKAQFEEENEVSCTHSPESRIHINVIITQIPFFAYIFKAYQQRKERKESNQPQFAEHLSEIAANLSLYIYDKFMHETLLGNAQQISRDYCSKSSIYCNHEPSSCKDGVKKVITGERGKKVTSTAGFEPAQAMPNRFRVCLLNHSDISTSGCEQAEYKAASNKSYETCKKICAEGQIGR
ncbi:hypothetical protein V6N13_098123 [Hibiscus sabdariffa]